MARFLFQDGQQEGREILLKPGVNRIGRREGNDCQIEDPTISSFHCEVHVSDGSVTVKDLGSTNGTFLNGIRIQEATLAPGQILKLGGLNLAFETGPQEIEAALAAPPIAPAIPAARTVRVQAVKTTPSSIASIAGAPGAQTRSPNDCAHHPGTPAAFICRRCGSQFCGGCVKTQRAANRTIYSCPSCSGLCVDINTYRKAQIKEEATFFSMVPDAFRYPLRQNGPILLVCGTIVFTLVDLAHSVLQHFRMSFFLGYAYWITLVMSVGYLFAFMQNIIVSSTNGEENMPAFPEVSNFADDILMPFIRFTVILLVCIGPGVAMIFWFPIPGVLVLLLGAFCFPMALLTVSLADSVAGLNPLIIFSGISKVPGAYLVTCLVLLGVTGLGNVTELLLKKTEIPLMPLIVSMPISLYGLTVGMRVLGLLYYTNKEKLAWFN